MSIKHGTKDVVDVFKGEELVERVYQGEELIFDSITEVTGALPLTFTARAAHELLGYKIYGTAEGAGVETENHFPYAEAGEYAFGARARVVSDGKGEFCIIGKITTNLETPVIPLTKPFTFPSVEDDERDTFFLGNHIQATNMNIRFYDENGALITYYTFNSQWRLVYNYPSLSGKTAYGIGFGSNSSASYSLDAYYVYPMFAKDQSITEYIPYGYKLPMTVEGGEKSTTPIYIGDSKLGEEEYVDYESGKVWKLRDNLFDAEQIVEDSVSTASTYIKDAWLRYNTGPSPITINVDGQVGETFQFKLWAKNFNTTSQNNIRFILEYEDGTTVITGSNSFAAGTERYVQFTSNSAKALKRVISQNTSNRSAGIEISKTLIVKSDTMPETYLQPTDPPTPPPPLTVEQGETSISSTETVADVSVKGRISRLD